MTAATFAEATAGVTYTPKGIFFSEVFLFLRACVAAGVSRVIESGVKHGTSTRLIAASFAGSLVSIDRHFFIEPPDGVTFIEGDSQALLPRLLVRSVTTGVLIDGPKGPAALALKDVCLNAGAAVVAVHDVAPGHGEHWHSQDAACRAVAAMLDAPIPVRVRLKYPIGPGLAIWGTT